MMDELLEAKRLATRLRRIRLERGLSLRGAAAKIGVTKETLSDLERARRHPHPPTLAKIAGGYGVEISDLLGPMVEEEPALLGKEAAPHEPGQPETAPPAEKPTIVPQSAGTLEADIERIKRLKKLHETDLEKIRRGELDYDAVLRMEAVDKGVRAGLQERGVLAFAEAVRARRELADDESLCRALLRELRYLEELTEEARALSAMVTSDIHEEVEKGASQAESWVSDRHEQSS